MRMRNPPNTRTTGTRVSLGSIVPSTTEIERTTEISPEGDFEDPGR